jgi:hypothetical protein
MRLTFQEIQGMVRDRRQSRDPHVEPAETARRGEERARELERYGGLAPGFRRDAARRLVGRKIGAKHLKSLV